MISKIVLCLASLLYVNGERYHAEIILKEICILGYGNKTYFTADEL